MSMAGADQRSELHCWYPSTLPVRRNCGLFCPTALPEALPGNSISRTVWWRSDGPQPSGCRQRVC